MLNGLMDHWVPSHDAVSRFWKTPFDILRPHMDKLCDDVGSNNFTFYTKWYTNGIKSSLPFLSNHPDAQNVLTDNDWGRKWIDYFHSRGMTVGAMLQCYTFEPGMLPGEGVLGTWQNQASVTGLDGDPLIVNPQYEQYPAMLEQMLEEHLSLFPGIDAIFLEFEGLPVVGPENSLTIAELSGGNVENYISPSTRKHWQDIRREPETKDKWVWAEPVQNALKKTLSRQLSAADRTLNCLGFSGIKGVVYHAFGYEIPYIIDSLPDRSWWHLPWNYWGWNGGSPDDKSIPQTSDEVIEIQINWCKKQFLQLVEKGYPVCYIGNCTLPTRRTDTITEMYNFIKEIGAAGYIGMGNPIPEYGLKWRGATEKWISEARRLYCE